MQSSSVSKFVLATIIVASGHSHANVIEVIGGIESGRFIDGVNLTNNPLAMSLHTEWSAQNGGFVSLSCFITERGAKNAINRGCDTSLGWFKALNNKHAITLAVSRHDYSSPLLRGWQYNDISASWHIGKKNKLKIKASDSLLGQNVNSVTASLHTARALNKHWYINLEAGLTSLEGSAQVNNLEYGVIGLHYRRGRWSSELKAMLSGSNYRRFVALDIDKPAISWNLKYRLY